MLIYGPLIPMHIHAPSNLGGTGSGVSNSTAVHSNHHLSTTFKLSSLPKGHPGKPHDFYDQGALVVLGHVALIPESFGSPP